ncbi:MAG: DUF389 domain-containing protein [Candidatus Dojkabacteria bacterium]
MAKFWKKIITTIPKSEHPNLRKKFYDEIEHETDLTISFIILISFATLIATLGLLTNSTAFVIGAMIIAPLSWPIMGVTLSIITSRRHIAQKALIQLSVSVGLILFLSLVATLLTTINQPTEEILIRTNPTVLDLFIAIASGVIAVLAVYYPRISSSATGAAVSLSLLPPLSVVGIGIAFGSQEIVLGALLLFVANVTGMIFSGVITMYLLRFRPWTKDDTKRFRLGLIASVISILVIGAPLVYLLIQTISESQIRSEVSETLDRELEELSSESQVDDILVSFDRESELVGVEATVFFPEGVFITNSKRGELIQTLSEEIDRPVDLQLNLINTLLAREEDTEFRRDLADTIENLIIIELEKLNEEIVFDSTRVHIPEGINQNATEGSEEVNVYVRLRDNLQDEQPITFNQKERVADIVSASVNQPISLEIELIPVSIIEPTSTPEQLEVEYSQQLKRGFRVISEEIELLNVDVIPQTSELETIELVRVTILTPGGQVLSGSEIELLSLQLQQLSERRVELEIRIVSYQ